MTKPLEEFEQKRAALYDLLTDEGFIRNRGLGNEVGIYILCYDPALELHAQELSKRLIHDSEQNKFPCRIVEHDLYDTLLAICEQKRILDKIPAQEEKRGADALLKQLQKVASAEAFAEAISTQPREENDVLLITGVGQVYPILRLHVLLENLQPRVGTTPLICLYPGTYTGQTMSLFSSLTSSNYYRAFNIV